jgi:hypothetical protein
MPRINLKSIFIKAPPPPVEVNNSVTEMIKKFMSSAENKASELYVKAVGYVANFAQDKSNGELAFMYSILAVVVLFVVVLPSCEMIFCGNTKEDTEDKRGHVSSNSSTTESLETIEESDEEDIPSPTEDVLDNLKFVDDDEEEMQVFVEQCAKGSEDEYDACSNSTPANVEMETPTASPCVTPERRLVKNTSVPSIATSKRSILAKMKGKMTSSVSLRKKDSTDASVTSTSSTRSFRKFIIKSKND